MLLSCLCPARNAPARGTGEQSWGPGLAPSPVSVQLCGGGLALGDIPVERREPGQGLSLCSPRSIPVLLGLSHEPVSVNPGAGAQGQGCSPGLFERLMLSKHRLMPPADSFCV